MKLTPLWLPSLLVFFAFPSWAHRPYIGEPYGTKEAPVLVSDPEISKAYYRKLNGNPEYFQVTSTRPFRLYLNLLEPYGPDAQKNFTAEVIQDNHVVATLTEANWLPYDEPWGGDQYWMGPTYDQEVPAGNYLVVVSNLGNVGKYAFAVGNVDTFPPIEIVRTLWILPKIKSEFFEKPPWTAYFNYSGLFVVVLFFFSGGIFFFGIKLARRLLTSGGADP